MHKHIQGLKLVTGEEVVAEICGEDNGEIFVKNPLVLHIRPGPEGFVINFLPWTIIAADGQIPIFESAVMSRYDVPKEVEDNYLQNTSGIQIVSGGAGQLLQG